jgi:RNA polymerase sigma-70 factor, ECF subfamily
MFVDSLPTSAAIGQPVGRSLEPSAHTAMLEAIPKLRRFAMKLCRNADQVDDLVQETLVRGCEYINSFQPGTNMTAWLTTILRNQFYLDCRRRQYRAVEPLDDYANILALPPPQEVSAEFANLRVALTALEPEEREALILILSSGYSYDESAKICDCPVGTVKSRVHRARAKVGKLLSISGPEATDVFD